MYVILTLPLLTALGTALAAAEPPPSAPAGRVWAVVVGVGELADPTLGPVVNAPADAERLRDHLTMQGGVAPERVLLLSDGGAPYFDPASATLHAAPTRRNVRAALATWLARRVEVHDVVVVAWSGQGALGPRAEPLLVTADAARDDLVATSVELAWVAGALSALPATGSLVWLDTSFVGRSAASPMPTAAAPRLPRMPARTSLWLAANDAPAREEGPHGAFTHALLMALRESKSPEGDPDDAWRRLLAALPAHAPRPLRLGQADVARLFAPRPARDRPELVLQVPHFGSVVMAAFDPTGRRLATTGDDGTLKLWSTRSHRIIANLDTPGGGAIIDWSPDGERLLAHAPAGVTVWSSAGRKLWSTPLDPATWAARGEVIRDAMGSVVRLSGDGALVVIPDRARTEIRAASDGRVVARLPAGVTHHGPAAWDPSGRWLAVGAANRRDVLVFKADVPRARARAAPDLRLDRRIAGADRLMSLTFSGDGGTLAVARHDPAGPRQGDFPSQRVTLYDARRAFAVRPTAAPLATIFPLGVSRDGRWLVAPGDSGATLVDLATLALVESGAAASGERYGGLVQFARDGRSFALYLADDTRVYDTSGALVRTIAGEAIALAPDLSAALSGSTRSWGDQLAFKDVLGRHPPIPLEAAARPILGLALAPGGARLVAKEPGHQVVWDVTSGRPVEEAVPATTPPPKVATPAGEAAVLHPTLAAVMPRVRFPHTLCKYADQPDDPAVCAPWDEAPAPGAFDVVLWDLAAGRERGVLRGHRGAVTGIAAARDGKTVVTTSLDTTMRLWDVASARELAVVALLPRDGVDPRWVVMTPDGLFDGSPAGQAEMQWRVGDTLFRLEQYAGELYTPGLFARLMNGERPRAALAPEELAPPPRVRIVAPAAGTSLRDGTVKVVVRVEDAGGGATPAWLYVNGRRVPATRARPMVAGGETFEVELVEGQNHIRATAFNRDGTVESAGDEVAVTWAVPETERPVLHLVAVGVDAYRDPTLRLAFAGADARAIVGAFSPGLFARIEPTLLLDAAATRDGIHAAIAAVAKKAQPRDALLVYLAGHGALVGSTFYFLPHEAAVATDDELARTGLSQAALAEALMQVPAMKQVVVLDACHSGAGAVALGRMIGQRDALGLARAQRRLAKASGVFLIAAATATQKAGEIAGLGHGILTHAILSGLGVGKPPAARTTADGQVTMNALLAWLDEEVPRLTARYQGGAQNPVQASTGQDFPITQASPHGSRK